MRKRKPEWLKIKINVSPEYAQVENILSDLKLNTICHAANCPNCNECFSKKKTATFMILGKYCTRSCAFCNVQNNEPEKVDETEPLRVAKAVKQLNLKHAVITSVTRDDLTDGGSNQFANVIREIRKLCQDTTIEVLIPDFNGNINSLKNVVDAKPDILNHNIETIKRLYDEVRPDASYNQSLELIDRVKQLDKNVYTKSGIMVGLGEKTEEVYETLKDLREYNCDIVTIGQYLQPSKKHYDLKEYIHPDIFKKYEEICKELGFKYYACSPLVRSSYNAADFFDSLEK